MIARLFSLCALALLPGLPARAHPHVFTEAGWELIFDAEGRLAGIRTHWVYDDFTSLLLVEDAGADADGDGAVSEEELAVLADFDSQWPEGYAGDLHVSQNGADIPAGPPFDWEIEWVEGKLGSWHSRSFDPPIDPSAGPLVLSPYDPSYYIAYSLAPAPVVTGREDCILQIVLPDLDAEWTRVQAEIAAIPPEVDPVDLGYADLGARFAERLVLTCGG